MEDKSRKAIIYTAIAICLVLVISFGTFTGYTVIQDKENKLPTNLCKTLIPKFSGSTPTITKAVSQDILGLTKNIEQTQVLSCSFKYTGEEYTRYPGKKASGTVIIYGDLDENSGQLFTDNFYGKLGLKAYDEGNVEAVYYGEKDETGKMSLLYFIYPGNHRINLQYAGGITSSNKPGDEKEGEVIWKSTSFSKSELISTTKEVKGIKYIITINLEGDISDYRFINYITQNYLKLYAPEKTIITGKDYRYLTFPYN